MRKNITSVKKHLTFDYGKRKIQIENIRYFESYAGNYTLVKLQDKANICSSFTLKHYAEKLESESNFVLIRKGLLVNFRYVKKITKDDSGNWITLTSGEQFKFSRRRAKEVEKNHKVAM